MKARMPQGFGGGNMLKQAQKLQEDMARMQAELEERTYTSAAGGGAVRATVSGKKEVVSVEIQPDVVDPDDIEMLQDLIVAAVNESLRKAEEDSTAEMQKLTGGLNLPGLM